MYTLLIVSHVRSHGTSLNFHMFSWKCFLVWVFLSKNKAMIDLLIVNVTDEREFNLNNTAGSKKTLYLSVNEYIIPHSQEWIV